MLSLFLLKIWICNLCRLSQVSEWARVPRCPCCKFSQVIYLLCQSPLSALPVQNKNAPWNSPLQPRPLQPHWCWPRRWWFLTSPVRNRHQSKAWRAVRVTRILEMKFHILAEMLKIWNSCAALRNLTLAVVAVGSVHSYKPIFCNHYEKTTFKTWVKIKFYIV